MKWLERLVGTPMAAPESARLRAMRLVWMALLFGTAVVILGIPLLKALLLPSQIGLLSAVLIALSVGQSWLYLSTKKRLDDAYVDQLAARRRAEEEPA